MSEERGPRRAVIAAMARIQELEEENATLRGWLRAYHARDACLTRACWPGEPHTTDCPIAIALEMPRE